MIGIYKITNLINNKSYVGQSKNIKKRWNQHRNEGLKAKNNHPLYRAMFKYGLENFSFEIIENCTIEELNDKEKYWINFFDSFIHGYNLTLGGDSSGTAMNKEKIIQIFKDLSNTDLTQKEIGLKNNISEEMVQGINTGRYWKRDDVKYPIREPHKKQSFYCIDCGILISQKAKRCLECENLRRKKDFSKIPISREELKNLIRTTSFLQIGKQFNVSDNAIRKWCDKFNLPRTKRNINSYSNEEWELI